MREPLTDRIRAIPLPVVWLAAIGFALGSMLLLSPSPGSTRPLSPPTAASPTPTPTPTPVCIADIDCSDGVFCNGIERCAPRQPGANSRGCVAAVPPSACNVGQECEEATRRCVIAGCADPDHDGDGHRSIRCGGDDCDDQDANRFPGRMEVCDAEGHDEDCDPMTYGRRDQDKDGEDDFRCFNRAGRAGFNRGTDYDDSNPAIRAGSMICDGPDAVVVSGSFLASVPCPTGTNCVVQPNRTGICIVPPTNYAPPPRFEWPLLPDSSVTIAPGVSTAGTDPAGGSAAEVAECKSTLQAGSVPSGTGKQWTSGNIDKLCNGTKNARRTIACFQSNVEALGLAAAIDKCK